LVLGFPFPDKLKPRLENNQEIIEKLQKELMTNFGLEANLKLEASPEEIFDENSETSILTHMIKGVEVEFKL